MRHAALKALLVLSVTAFVLSVIALGVVMADALGPWIASLIPEELLIDYVHAVVA